MADAALTRDPAGELPERVLCTLEDRQQLPAGLDWLTPSERERFEAFRFDKRRNDWLLGRWAAKVALLNVAAMAQSDIGRFEIRSAPNGAPLPWLDEMPFGARLSLSHSNDHAFAAVLEGNAALGCDIELIEPRSASFVETFFTDAERERVANTGADLKDTLVTMIWSAKESMLKALHTGLHADTRSVEVIDDGNYAGTGWHRARTVDREAGEYSCLWRVEGRFVLTVVTSSSATLVEGR